MNAYQQTASAVEEQLQSRAAAGIGGSLRGGLNEWADVPQQRPPQIAVQFETLTKEIANQEETVSRLQSRLQAVLSLPELKNNCVNKAAQEPTCPLAAGIAQLTARVASNTAILLTLMDRLEL